jgi:uncharacterized protein YyaL (SSP411 family)
MSNYLKNETSSYLKEYINTPINWYPYNSEALQKAKEQKRPIFLSIGYSGSYLCQVMKKESFENQTIAQLLNNHFIPIKIDKDEHTDIDKYYKQVYKLMNGQNCASPLCVFLTEDQKPFYSTGYIAPIPQGNVLGMEELLNIIITKYKEDYNTLLSKGEEVLRYLTPNKKIEATRLNLNTLISTTQQHTKRLMDKESGGFDNLPKFLHISTLDLLLEIYQMTDDNELFSFVQMTLKKMINGEIYDKKEGGFYRYANTKSWGLPRKEKLTYDNALIAILLLNTYKLSGETLYKKIAIETLEFLLKKHSDGTLFYTNSFENEEKRVIVDPKITTSFNAMVINALLYASRFEEKYLDIAINALDTLLKRHYHNRELLHTQKIKAFLEDYAYLSETLLSAYKISQNQKYIILAEEISNRAIEQFYEHGRWRFSSNIQSLYDDIYDPLYPSSMATMLLSLHQLSFKIESDYNPLIFKSLELNSYLLMRQPLSSPKMSKVLLRHLKKML